MREIRFRVWDKKNKIMLQPHPVMIGGGGYLKQEQNDSILMQYTGLNDCEGKEIYEGDIVYVQCIEDFKTVVKWDEDEAGWSFEVKVGGKRLYKKPAHWEVIGNIYENPELLDKEINNKDKEGE